MFKLIKEKILIFMGNRNKSIENDDKCKRICYDMGVNSMQTKRSVKSMYTAIEIANWLIAKCNEDGKSMSNLRLQKTLYYVQGYFLKNFNLCAFEEDIYAWAYGPVVQEAYFEFNDNGSRAIELDAETAGNILSLPIKREHKRVIEKVLKACNEKSVRTLVGMTHDESPWKNTPQSNVISIDKIASFFDNKNPLSIEV